MLRPRPALAAAGIAGLLLAGVAGCRQDQKIHERVTPNRPPAGVFTPYRSATPGPADSGANPAASPAPGQ